MRKWIYVLIVLIIAGVIGYNYVYQDHRDIKSEVAEFSMNSKEITNLFSQNTLEAEQKLLNKTVEVSGIISDVNTNAITLNDKVFCQFSEGVNISKSKDSKIKIKGRVIGYDDLLEQVKLDQCTIIN